MKILCLFLIAARLLCTSLAAHAQSAQGPGKAAPLTTFDYSALEQVALKKQRVALQGAKTVQRNAADKAFTTETDPILLSRLMGDRQAEQSQGMAVGLLEANRHSNARQKAIRDSLWKKANYPVKGSFLEKMRVSIN